MIGLAMLAAAGMVVITNPDWLERPTAELMADNYPPMAGALDVKGRAVISCTVAVDGRAKDCKVVGEEPMGWGFGQAVYMSGKFRFKPKTEDGKPVEGTINVPINFGGTGGRAPAAYVMAEKCVGLQGDVVEKAPGVAEAWLQLQFWINAYVVQGGMRGSLTPTQFEENMAESRKKASHMGDEARAKALAACGQAFKAAISRSSGGAP